MNDTDARLWHPWLRINRVLRAADIARLASYTSCRSVAKSE
jgi:hypothetical protein